jgi:phosphotriesterase-related protein
LPLVPSVTGPLDVADIGRTLTHDHFFVDLTTWACLPRTPEEEEFWNAEITIDLIGQLRRRAWSNASNIRLDDFDTSVEELLKFKELGGGTVFDVTPPTVGRDVDRIRRLAEATGIQIICGTGFYVHEAHPPMVAGASVEELAGIMVRELTEGIDGTGIRAGIIGEIGTSAPIHPDEIKVLHAAAAAARRTGAMITLHMTETDRLGHEVLDLLEADGIPLTHVILGHSDGPPPDMGYFTSLMDRGACIEFDFFGATWRNDDLSERFGAYFIPPAQDEVIAAVIADLFSQGYGDRILMSQDVCLKTQLTRYGGYGYGHILRTIVPQLRWLGVADADIERMMVDTPRRMVTWIDPSE